MNKIFKKIWNQSRGCFVAVSEAITAARQNTGKATVLIGSIGLLLSGSSQAAVVINGNVHDADSRLPNKHNHIFFISEDTTINGNFDYNLRTTTTDSRDDLLIGCVSDNEHFSNVNLVVNGTTSFGPETWVSIGQVGNGSASNVNASLTTRDLNVSGWLYLGSRAVNYQYVPLTSRLVVSGTMNLYGSFFNTGHKTGSGLGTDVHTSGTGSFSIGTLNNWGNFNLASKNMNVSGEIGRLNINGGSFNQNPTNNIYIRDELVLNSGSLVTQQPITVGQRAGNFSIGSSFVLAGGSLNQTGLLTQKAGQVSVTNGSYAFGTINKENGSLSNFGTLSITNFNQSNGSSSNSGNLSIGNANLFGTLVNTGTLTLTSNVTSRGNLTNNGNLNNRGNWTETNRFTIAGNLNNSGFANFQNGFQFGNGRLTSSGTIQTNNAFDVFDSLGTTGQQGLHYVALNSTVPQEVKTSLTDFFLKYVPGTVAKTLADHASFTSGKVIVTGVNLTQTQAVDLTKAFKEQFGSATTLEFQGTIAGVSHDDKLTVAKTNELYDNVEHLRDVIFVDRKLEGENGAIVVGNSGLRNNTGFTGINEATGTTIQDGKELTLIGGKSDGTGNRFTLAEKVISAVGSGAKLILGSLGIKDSSLYQGQASEVNLSNGGELRIAAGDYLVTNHTSSGGTTTVDKNSTFRSDNGTFTDKAVLENNGETVLGALNGWNSAEVRNNGKLTVSGNTQFGGRFINNANAKLVGTADIDGTLQNSQGARLIANTVNVNGTLRNFGYMEALDNSTVFGTLENPGEIRLFNTAIGSRGDGNIGTIGNTYTLKATGKTQVSGLIANASGAVAEFTGDDSELTVLSGGVVSNNGTLIADSLVINNGGYFINGDNAQQTFATSPLRLRKVARAVARATEQLKNLTVSEGGSKTNNGIAYYGTGSIAGEFINASGAEAFGGVSDIFVDGSGLGITNTGAIKNAGTFTFGGTLNNSGSITGDGLIVFKRAGLGNDTFTNAGQIKTGSLEADNIKYVQTAGSLSSASGWFSNSTVDLTGGTIEHAVLGSGNTYNLGAGSGSNDAATFTVGTLDSSSVVNINRGATLRTEHIAMDGHKTTNLQGGRLSTTLDQVFADLDYSTLNLDAVNPEDKVEVSSNPQIVTGIGNVIGSVAQGIAFQWGTVAFDDASYSAALAGDAVNKLVAIGDVPADRRGELEVAFNGKAAERFNVDLANSIKATAAGTLAYATFANETLSNESAANPGATSLVVGVNDSAAVVVPISGTPNVLNQSMGFMNVTGVSDGLYINSGSHFVLVGQAQPNPNLAPVELADGAVWVGGNRNDNGNLTPSKLTLGSYGSAAATKGHLAELNIGISPANNKIGGAGGQVIVKNGEFTVDVLNNGSAGYGNDREGLVIGNADDTATQLIVGSYTAVDGSAMSNHGIFKAQNIASRNTNNSFVNHGTFDIGTADISGYLENNGTAEFNELTLREYGSVNKQGAELTAGKLTVSGNALAGASGTYGIRGSLENQGKLSVTDELTVAGDMTNSGEVDIAKLTVQAATPVQDATAGSFINNALAKMDSLLTEAGSLVTNAADAVLTIAGLNGASELNGTVTNDGTLKVDGTQSVTVASGELNNNGTMENTNALNVTGGTVGNNGSLALNGLNVSGGQVQNAAEAQFKDSGTTKIEMADAADVGIANEGHLELSNLMLLKGMIQGGSVGSKDVTLADVRQDASIEAEKVQLKELNNAGTVKATEFAAAKSENTGNVEVGNLILAENDRFFNQAAGSVKADQLVLNGGEFVNAGGNTSDIALTQIATGGQFTSDGDSNLQKVVSNEGTINLNKGNLNIAELDAKNSVYNQLGGHFKADKGFFEDSTLNIKGGIFDASEVRDSEGNVTGLLGNNTVNISGGNQTPVIDNEDSAENKSHYKDNLTQVIAGVVNSDTTVNIMEGGVLDAAKIELDGTKADTINLQGGVLQTSADQIFGSVTTEAIRIDAADAETGTVQLPTTVLSATTVGAVKDEIKAGLNVESGNLALDDDYFSASLIVSVTDKIANAFENAANLTINFLGEMTAPFTITTANDLEKEGLDVVKNPGIVLNTTLHNEFADEYNKDTDASQTIKGLIIGAESNDPNTNSINISMGFKDVSHTDKVTIEGGKELVLVGNAVNAIPEGSFGDDANKLLKDSADGGSIDVNNGTFTFGSHGGVTPTVGWILSSNIGENGALEAKNGEFADWTIANNGNVHVHSNAILHTNSLTGNGAAVNEGKLSLDEKDGTGPTFDVAGSFTNKGGNSVLDASKVEKVTVSGTHINEGQADYKDMLVAEGGSSTNSGTEQGNILTVEGSHVNTGTSIWNGVTVADKGKGENAGKLDVGSVFDVLGEFVNKGAEAVLDATKTAVANVAGILRNEGTANYDDMTIADGGKSENVGFEKGDILTVANGGEHSNSGTSIWNNVTVETGASSSVEAGGKETINDAYVIAGDRVNKGEVDATGVESTEVTGTLDNQGTSNYDDMTVGDGGKSNNSGYEKGDILIIEDGGEHINSGTSIWNNQTVQVGGSATTEEGGKETINDKYVIAGDKTNKGEVDATKVTDTLVSGTLDNQGKSEYDDMTIQGGGTSNNSGYEKGDILTIDPDGVHDNSGTSIWNNVVVAGGDVNNIGDIETGKLTIDDGLVKIDGGSLKAEETDLNGGDLVIGNDREPSEENHVKAEINPEGDVIDTNIYVKNNGDLNLGPTGGLDWADSIGSPTVPSGTPSRLVITNNVTTGPGGGIAVGPNVWSDKDNHVQIGNGDLFFAKDSLTVIDSSILTDGKSAFNTTSDIAKVTVEQGANLVLGNIDEVGDYTIVNGYITGGNESDDGMWTGGWTGDNLYALPQDGSGINWILTLHNDPSKIWVNATLADVRTVYPDIAIPNIANDDLLHCKSGDAGADFVCRVLRDKELDVAGKTKVINSVANIAFAGGAMSVSMNDLNTAADSIEGRVSMRNEAFTEYGVMREWDRGNDLWVDVIGGKQKYKSLSATGISKAGFDTNAYGLVMGYDRKFADKPIILGAAFSYNHGSFDSTGDVLKTKNKYNSFGLHAYGAYAPVEKVNLIGTLSWMRNSSDITQSINAAGFNKADADVKTNMFSLGARAEATIPAGKANIVPHAGLRYVLAKSGKYDTKVDGKKVWSNKADATNTFQLPIGVAVRTDIATASGWNIRPQADVTVIPQFGDTKQKTKLSNFNGVSDKLSGEFAGKFGTNVNLGVQADKGPATFGVRYGFTGGTKGKADHAFKFEARYRF